MSTTTNESDEHGIRTWIIVEYSSSPRRAMDQWQAYVIPMDCRKYAHVEYSLG